MLREVSEDMRVRVKDGLRELRSIVRKHRHDHAASVTRQSKPQPVRGIEDLLGHAVSAFDDAMTLAEHLAPSPARIAGPPGPKPLHAYFRARGDDELDGARAFRRDLYRLASVALRHKELHDVVIREADFAAVHGALDRSQAEPIARLHVDLAPADRRALVAWLTAALFLQLERRKPIRLPARDGGVDEGHIALDVLATIALGCGMATLEMEGATGPELMEIAALAVDARSDRIEAAMGKENAQAELAALFESLLAHLN